MLASIWSTVLVFTGCPALLEPDAAPLEIAELSVADEVPTTGVEEVAALVTDTSVELLPLGWLTAAVFDEGACSSLADDEETVLPAT